MKNSNNKRILVLPGIFFPHNETITQISYKMLCNLDYEIDVVSFKGNEDPFFSFLLNNDKKSKKFHIHYIDYDWKSLDINSNNYNIFKIINLIRIYVKKSIELSKKYSYEFLFSFSMPNYTHYAAYKIKRKNKGIKWYASFSDPISNNLYIEELKTKNIKSKILYLLLRLIHYRKKYEKFALEYSDKLIFISKALRDFVIREKVQYKNKSIIYPITFVKDWPNYRKLTGLKQKVNDKKKKIIFSHFGNIYGLRKIEKFVDAVNLLLKEDTKLNDIIEINLYGDIDKEQLKYIKNNSNNVIKIHSRVNYDECIDLMNKSDVLLIFDTIIEENQIQPFLPSKIIDYLLSSKPIFAITIPNSPLYDIINKKHICVCYDAIKIKEGLQKQFLNLNIIKNDINMYDNNFVSKKTFESELDIIDLGDEKNE